MGLLDILNGMQQGPRGASRPGASSGGGISPVTMALLGLVAYKAVKSFSGAQTGPSQAATGSPAGNPGGGGLLDMVGALLGKNPAAGSAGVSAATGAPGGLGSVFGGTAAGSVLTAGLASLVREFQDRGQGGAAQSWIGTGPNQAIAPNDLASVLGGETVDTLAKQTGMGRPDLLASLSQHLPQLIDLLTPNGRLPTEQEASRMV